MADQKTTQLTETTTFASTDVFHLVTDVTTTPVSKKIKASNALVTNGNSHDHSGGDGATIAYSSLSGTLTQAAGTYTPTLSNTTNVASSAVNGTFQYLRLGSIVTVAGSVQVDPTAAAATVLKISLPIASNFTTSYQANGNATNPGSSAQFGSIISETDDTVSLNFTALSTANAFWRIMFTYEII